MLLVGEITFDSVNAVFTEMEKGTLDRIFICTEGGRVDAAWAIYDLIVGRGIQVIGLGSVASAGLIILLGGDIRTATENTRFMSHPIQVSGHLEAHGAHFKEIDTLSAQYQRVLVERAGMDEKTARKFSTKTVYFGVDEAMNYGVLNATVTLENEQAA